MNHNDFLLALAEEDEPLATNLPSEPARARKRTICQRCGENHRTSTHDRCIAEGRPLPNQPRRLAGQAAQRGRPVVAANPLQAHTVREAALFGEFDEDGDDAQDGQVPDLLNDNIDSDDSDDEDEAVQGARPGQWQEIIDEQPKFHQSA